MQTKTRQQLDAEVERAVEEFSEVMQPLLRPRDYELERAALALDEKIIFPRVLH